ncbi:MAG: hypothetical protein WDO19_21820 [Bacteroidota bacterium]
MFYLVGIRYCAGSCCIRNTGLVISRTLIKFVAAVFNVPTVIVLVLV